jgi:hypothetical protein
MRFVHDNDALNLIERFVVELRAIERWDAGCWGTSSPKAYEMLAFVARRKGRAEILAQLLILIPRLDKEEGLLWPCGKPSPEDGEDNQRLKRLTCEAELKPREARWCRFRGNKYVPFS